MSLVGKLTFEALQETFINLTPVISRIYAYPKWDRAVSDNILCIHFVTDDGEKNTVIPRLWRRAEDKIHTAYEQERSYGLYDICFCHTGPGFKIPSQAQLIYQRTLMSSGIGEA